LVVQRARSTVDVLQTPTRVATYEDDVRVEGTAALAVDGRDDTAWIGAQTKAPWIWSTTFGRPVHVGLLRSRFGQSPTSGVPTEFQWEVRPPSPLSQACPPEGDEHDWAPIDGTSQAGWQAGPGVASATRRSWFVDVDACGLRLVVKKTNAGPPVIREVRAIASARNILLEGKASDEGAWPGLSAEAAIDGRYGTHWAGNPGANRWVLRVDLATPQPIDRVRLVVGFDATSIPRSEAGRGYAVAWGPLHYSLEVSEDGYDFVPVASEPLRSDGSLLPLRRRLVTLAQPRLVRAVRLLMSGATGADGLPDAGAVPVVREIAAYRSDDHLPVLAPPWILSINANPSSQTHATSGGELANDIEHARFLQGRFAKFLPTLRRDNRYARELGARGEILPAPLTDDAGEALESIEGDDPVLDAQLLSQSSPPPIAVLSGSNDWDYASETRPDPTLPKRWHWDPLLDPSAGGLGQLAPAVRGRVTPFIGFCGGAQILALLEAKGPAAQSDKLIDRILSRTSGVPIRGFAAPTDVARAWPGDPHPLRATVQFTPQDPLFIDLAGSSRRSTTKSLPEWHADAIRLDAFGPGEPLERLQLVATSTFCPRGGTGPSSGCAVVPEAFRSKDPSWPVIGAQFHAEQHEFAVAAPDEPAEAVADPRLFVAGAYEEIVDAYERYAP
jgi:hypothetical protein